MGAGFAELFLGRNRSGGQIVPNSRNRIHSNPWDGAKRKNTDAPGGAQPGDQARSGSKKDSGIISVSAEKMNKLAPPESHHVSAALGWLGLGNVAEAKAE